MNSKHWKTSILSFHGPSHWWVWRLPWGRNMKETEGLGLTVGGEGLGLSTGWEGQQADDELMHQRSRRRGALEGWSRGDKTMTDLPSDQLARHTMATHVMVTSPHTTPTMSVFWRGHWPFRGKTIVFGGDFRQVLSIVRKGSRGHIITCTCGVRSSGR
jgi:hypothetical protein